ncbi:alpha/beta fold hydrolase [Nocardia bovistercoris]|uniref:Alpha/beta hydrolase n=1 Tax=Nocardia bovistercoris TaxID=2785916 RepID=A0A931I956_9NOCA|nr:alpha/beta hydrolase [Nocardia bovistercoris]MBH0775638.1 alpha/beta hydrolase [Nocardia bovistercoris]
MAVFAYRGRSVVYDRVGSGPPAFLLHNAGTQRHIWDDQVAALRGRHTVIALDLPGFGESDPATGHRLDDYVDMFAAFIDDQGGREAILIGNCVGSAIALSYADRHPDRVRALVLCNPLTWNTVHGGASAGLARVDALLPLGPLARRLTLPEPAVSMIVATQLGARGRRVGLHRSPRLRAHLNDRGRLFALDRLVQDFPAYRALDTLRPGPEFPPICTLWGKQNRVLSAAAGARLDTTLRPHTSVVLDDCGHLPMAEDPDAVTAVVTGFLTAVTADRATRATSTHAV